jgi:hypothetical protein
MQKYKINTIQARGLYDGHTKLWCFKGNMYLVEDLRYRLQVTKERSCTTITDQHTVTCLEQAVPWLRYNSKPLRRNRRINKRVSPETEVALSKNGSDETRYHDL